MRVNDDPRGARWVRTYGEAKAAELVLLVDSYGLVSLALSRESAAAALAVRPGTTVTLGPLGE